MIKEGKAIINNQFNTHNCSLFDESSDLMKQLSTFMEGGREREEPLSVTHPPLVECMRRSRGFLWANKNWGQVWGRYMRCDLILGRP